MLLYPSFAKWSHASLGLGGWFQLNGFDSASHMVRISVVNMGQLVFFIFPTILRQIKDHDWIYRNQTKPTQPCQSQIQYVIQSFSSFSSEFDEGVSKIGLKKHIQNTYHL